MPHCPPVVSRRTVLLATGLVPAALVAGCRRASPTPAPSPAASPSPDPASRLLARAQADERRLLSAYDAALRRHPALRPALDPVRAHHAAHLSALGGTSPSPPAPGPIGGSLPAVPRAAADLRALARAEQAAAVARAADCLDAPPPLASLLASIGASEAAHVVGLPVAPGRGSR